jgi:regulator of protease activity HflC (stomatin/prohibitin superfamily)
MSDNQDIKTYPGSYWVVNGVLLLVFIGCLFAGIMGIFPADAGFPDPLFGGTWTYNGLLATALVLWTVLSIRKVDANEQAAIILYGLPIRDTGPGLKLILRGVFTLVIMTKTIIEDEIPGDPEHVVQPEKGMKQPEGTVPPIRITTGGKDRKAGDDKAEKMVGIDPLESRLAIEVAFFYRYTIISPIQCYVLFGDEGDTFREVKKQFADIGTRIVTDAFGQMTPAEIIQRLAEIQDKLRNTATAEMGGSIRIHSFGLKPLGFGKDLNVAIQKIATSRAEATATITTAEATRRAAKLEGRGEGSRRKAELSGETEALVARAAQLNVDGAGVLGAEVAREIAKGPNQTIIVGASGAADLIGIATAAAKGMNPKKPAEKGSAS